MPRRSHLPKAEECRETERGALTLIEGTRLAVFSTRACARIWGQRLLDEIRLKSASWSVPVHLLISSATKRSRSIVVYGHSRRQWYCLNSRCELNKRDRRGGEEGGEEERERTVKLKVKSRTTEDIRLGNKVNICAYIRSTHLSLDDQKQRKCSHC